MKYIPSIIPAAATGTPAALLHLAADRSATDLTSTNVILDAAITLRSTAADTEMAAQAATAIAASRHRHSIPGVDPLTNWTLWQLRLEEPWPILQDAAAWLAEPHHHITPGRWTP